MVLVSKFSAEKLVSCPRRGPAVPNHDGTLALYTQSDFDISHKQHLQEIRILNVQTGGSYCLVEDEKAHDAVWLGDGSNKVVYLGDGEDGSTWVLMTTAEDPASGSRSLGATPTPAKDLKLKALHDGSIALVTVGMVDGNVESSKEGIAEQKYAAVVHDEVDARVWTSEKEDRKNTLWYSRLRNEAGTWTLDTPLHNLLANTQLELPIDPFYPSNTTHNFDISEDSIIFAANDRDVSSDALLTRGGSSIHHAQLESFSQARSQPVKQISMPRTSERCICTNPRFSPDGGIIAFLRAPVHKPSKTSVFIKHTDTLMGAMDVSVVITGTKWHLAPQSLDFSRDGHSVYMTAHDCGIVGLYSLELQPNAFPRTVLREGSVSAYFPLGRRFEGVNRLLVTTSTMTEPSAYHVVDMDSEGDGVPWVVSSYPSSASLGLSSAMVSDMWFEGGGDYVVHSWVVKPRDFDAGRERKYPLCLLVHDGPGSAWTNAWSSTLSPALWAEQGYIVVCPNITGSEGYGSNFQDAVNDNWGGRPYDDLVACVEHLKDLPGIDLDNAIAAGAGYGGYMMNWIQGHELGRQFKAIISQDAIFHLPTWPLRSPLPFSTDAFGGPPFMWNNTDGLERYNPARPDLLRNWKTPMLVVVNNKGGGDEVSSEGIAAFRTLRALGTPAGYVDFAGGRRGGTREGEGELDLVDFYRIVFEWIGRRTSVVDAFPRPIATSSFPQAIHLGADDEDRRLALRLSIP